MLGLLFVAATVSPAQVLHKINPFPVPATHNGNINSITPGPDGALWFTYSYEHFDEESDVSCQDRIGRMTTKGSVTFYPVPTACADPYGIAPGPDDALWFTEYGADKIGRITTSGAITEYATPSRLSSPVGITAGPDGAMWFTEEGVDKIGRITTSGAITEYPVPPNSFGRDPQSIAAGPDGALWFVELSSNEIGRITTSGVITNEFPVPTPDSGPHGITAGPDGALWFTEANVNKIGRITTSGVPIDYPVPPPLPPYSFPWAITAGPDGALWFLIWAYDSEVHVDLRRITTSGDVTTYPLPYGSAPFGTTLGPDGALWLAGNCDHDGCLEQVILERAWNPDVTCMTAPASRSYCFRPVPMGVSVSNTPSPPYVAATAGLLVRSVTDPNSKFILSNNHLLGAVSDRDVVPPTFCPNTATKGVTWSLQPGIADIGKDPGRDEFYYVGTVANFWPLRKDQWNTIDAAISATDASHATPYVLGIGQPAPRLGPWARLNEGVVKSGRMSGVTAGTVTDINCTTEVDYGKSCGSYSFRHQIGIFGISRGAFSLGSDENPFGRRGDSGSVILDSTTLTPIGLLFSGDSWSVMANPIRDVYVSLMIFPDGPVGSGPQSAEELRAASNSLNVTLDPQLARLEEIQARHEDELLAIPGVNGICIGLHENGQDLVFRVHVAKRTAELELAVPGELEGVPVRLVETGGPFRAY